jgi:hypothetical protein
MASTCGMFWPTRLATASTRRRRIAIYMKHPSVCQRSYPWQTEHCVQCGAKLVPKIERVEVEER